MPGHARSGWGLFGLVAVLLASAAWWWHATQPVPRPRPPLPPDTGMARVRSTGVLRVAMDATYPPFAVTAADGTVHGFDVDLADAIGREIGARVHFLNIGEDGLPDALISGQADVVISEQHPDRRLDLSYSAPYYNAGEVLLVAAGSGVTGLVDLRGQTTGVELGSDADEWVRRQHSLALRVQRYQTVSAALQALQEGGIAAVITDAPNAAAVLRQALPIRQAGPALTQDPYVIAAAPQNLSLIRAVNAVLARMRASGALQQLLQKDV